MKIKKFLTCELLIFVMISNATYGVDDFRVARYTLQSNTPDLAQTNLLSTPVQIKFPAQVASVGEAIDFLLQRSGYTFILTQEFVKTASFPLPYVHRKLGPIDVRRGLQTLAGRVWKLQENHKERTVWFQLAGAPNGTFDLHPNFESPSHEKQTPPDAADTLTNPYYERNWLLMANKTLRSNLQEWCNSVNWTLQWNVRHDYEIYHDSIYRGTFLEAVHKILEHYQQGSIPLAASFYSGNSVLVITPYHSIEISS